jgi:hypothetical protein
MEYLVHFTSKTKYQQILYTGYIKPPEQTNPDSSHYDKSVVCFYKNFNIENKDLISQIKKQFPEWKRNAVSSRIPEEYKEIIGLVFYEKDIEGIKGYEKQTDEIWLDNQFISPEYKNEIGIYAKTTIPVSIKNLVTTI